MGTFLRPQRRGATATSSTSKEALIQAHHYAANGALVNEHFEPEQDAYVLLQRHAVPKPTNLLWDFTANLGRWLQAWNADAPSEGENREPFLKR